MAQYPVWFQNVLSAIGLNSPTRYKIGGEGFTGILPSNCRVKSVRCGIRLWTSRWDWCCSTLLVYLVMVAQFRSFLDPLIVMVTVPLGFIGVAFVLTFWDTRLNIQSFMGIIMMIGIVVEYTIVLLDFANHRLAEGATVHQAIVDAAIVRFRPILMTSVTTILALLPMAVWICGRRSG